MSGGLSGASGYSRGPSGASRASGYSRGPLGPPGASGYSRGPSGASWGLRLLPGALWGLLGPSGFSRGPSGASWGLRLLPGALSLPAKPIWRWCGSVRVGAPLGSAGKKRAAPRALLPVDAGPRGGERRRPRGGRATAPWACPFSQHREKIGWGSLGICIVAAESCAARWSGRGAEAVSVAVGT